MFQLTDHTATLAKLTPPKAAQQKAA